ncbi:MAG: bifunctional glutamate N-acetyltransferase/amino-acid acetyltransferase ArgJ [Gemmatimonadetes bacterium]|nr:bifunctional glutamate N-acetyltransferase/amino-acid acetyltransferase ArgJ [Gemmatimonadota bacterium]
MRPFVPPHFPPAEYTLTHVAGLKASGVAAGIKESGRPDVALLASDRPLAAAGVFTRNLLAAAPVTICREHLRQTRGWIRAVVVNSGNANACTGEQGRRDAVAMCDQVARGLGCRPEEVLVCSTGVIGRKLPMDRVRTGIERAIGELSAEPEAGRRFLAAIMTTDAFPKEAGARFELGGGPTTVAGVCKGAGMIQPDMATMLAFLATDAALSPHELNEGVGELASRSFNAVHVDTHTSTNDSFLLLSAQSRPTVAEQERRRWWEPATTVARRLAWLIARDGEGATKVTTIEVRGASSNEAAREVAQHVAASALVRTALFGNDPNWGRFVSQVGNCKAVRDASGLRCVLQGITVFERGEPTAFDRAAASKAMAVEDVSLVLELAEGQGQATLMTSDLGYRYVEVNAEYTT